MTASAAGTCSNITPCLRYRDALNAIDWLGSAFGFKKQLVVPHPDGSIAHAQLALGPGMFMLGSVPGEVNAMSGMLKQPDEVEGFETQSPYIMVPDADSVYATAKAAGATIVREVRDESYGGRAFRCRDVEGHPWHVGTFNPWGPRPVPMN